MARFWRDWDAILARLTRIAPFQVAQFWRDSEADLWERIVIECKVLRESDRKSLAGTIERGVEQTFGYMAKCRTEEGHLVAFDRRENKSTGGAVDRDERRVEAGSVTVWLL